MKFVSCVLMEDLDDLNKILRDGLPVTKGSSELRRLKSADDIININYNHFRDAYEVYYKYNSEVNNDNSQEVKNGNLFDGEQYIIKPEDC